MNLADELSKQAQARPVATAVSLPTSALSFYRLEELTWRVATSLRQNGVQAGDVVALSFADELALLVTLLATARIGATAFSVPGSAPPFLRAEMTARVKARILATDHGEAESIAGLSWVPVDIAALEKSAAQIDAGVRENSPAAPWLIITGSGSTGNPKLFAVTHAQFLARTALAGAQFALSPADRLASLAHPDFTSPKERYLAALFAGASVVLFDRGRVDPLALCRDRQVTVLDATVFHVERLLGTLRGGTMNRLGMLRVLLLSASTVNDGLRRRIAAGLSHALHVRYGTNETGPLTIVRPDEILGTPGSVGNPPAGVEVEVVDSRGRPLPAGRTGLIRVKSPGMIARYLDDEAASARAFRNGWFMPGDLGRFAPNGHLVFCGRADHMMIMNGINIYPAEIERAVSRHPAVLDVAAIPLRSAMHQDLPACAVVLREQAQVTKQALLDFAFRHLGSHGPKQLVVLERIPRNEQGKPIHAQLLREIEDGLRRKRGTAPPRATPPILSVGTGLTRLRQPARQTRIRLADPAAANLDAIDDWLKSCLATEIEPCGYPVGRPADIESKQMAGLAWRVLLLYRTLLQAARVPVFDPGRVLGIAPDRGHPPAWLATVAVVQIDQISPQCHSTACTEAVRLIEWMADKSRTPENTEALFDTLQKQVLPGLLRMVTAGKSTLPVLRAAYARDIPFIHLGAGVYQLGWGRKSRRMDRSTTEMDSAIGSKLAQNKVWSANLIRMAGLPAPRQDVAATPEEALRMARRLGWPVVVKPVDRDRGEGVTVGITGPDPLLAAFKAASRLARSRRVIVEKEVAGVCHRLFIANGQLLYAVKRLPKSIHGDGRRTVAALIHAANLIEDGRPPWLRSERYPDDPSAAEAMAAAGFSPDAIPAAGERVPLRTIESTAWGGFDEDETSRVHPANLDIALRAAALFGLHVAGIDIITPDIGRPWHETGAIINEVNFAPLFGGGEISRSHIPEFLARFIDGDGRIPIEVIVGGDSALDMAQARQKELSDRQVRCVVTSHETTLSPAGEVMPFPFRSLYQRCRALLMDERVETIVLVVQTDELLQTGLPVDRIDRITTSGNTLKRTLPQSRIESLQALLRLYAEPPDRS
ncbi:MAG: AMP-binding protein [Rhodocyclaceae bacterium]|nr:AMP-binding protein [Rhodocyclaceae bacterium]